MQFPADLIRKGYNAHGVRTAVDPAKHLLRTAGNAPALDVRAVRYWLESGVQEARVYLKDGRTMHCNLGIFMASAKLITYGKHGRQYVAPASVWRTYDAFDLFSFRPHPGR